MSIDFKPISLENISLINSFTSIEDNYSCEFAPANLIMWNKAYNYEFAEFSGGIIIRLKFKGRFLYQLPFGDIEKGINLILKISESFLSLTKTLADKYFGREDVNCFKVDTFDKSFSFGNL